MPPIQHFTDISGSAEPKIARREKLFDTAAALSERHAVAQAI